MSGLGPSGIQCSMIAIYAENIQEPRDFPSNEKIKPIISWPQLWRKINTSMTSVRKNAVRLNIKTGYIVKLVCHSVEITEIYSHTLLTKIRESTVFIVFIKAVS